MHRPRRSTTRSDETTALLNRWAGGCAESGEELMARLYPDLRRLAARQSWNRELSTPVSDLAQNLCLRLAQQRQASWNSRGHFFALAAKLIRRVVVDELRHRRRQKRGAGTERVSLAEVELESSDATRPDLVALDEALTRLGRVSPAAVRVVELRYFAGLGIDETAAVLEVGRTTVVRQWRFARAWLHGVLSEGSAS